MNFKLSPKFVPSLSLLVVLCLGRTSVGVKLSNAGDDDFYGWDTRDLDSMPGGEVVIGLLESDAFDDMPFEHVARALDPVTNGLFSRGLNRLSGGLPFAEQGRREISTRDLIRSVDHSSGGLLMKTLNRHRGRDIIRALENGLYAERSKRTGLDPMSGVTVGESRKRSVHSLERKKRNFDEIDRSALSGFRGKKNFDEIDRSGFSRFNGKRNFDEIDKSGFRGFSGKRNFDEIDRSGFRGFYKRNFDEIDRSGFSGFDGKRNFDEIDRSGFSGFNGKRNFDEIDRSGFRGFAKRNFDEIDRSGFSGFNGKRNFDEIDRSGFSGFNGKRNFDEIDRSGFRGFNKRNFDEINRSAFEGFMKKREANPSAADSKAQPQAADSKVKTT